MTKNPILEDLQKFIPMVLLALICVLFSVHSICAATMEITGLDQNWISPSNYDHQIVYHTGDFDMTGTHKAAHCSPGLPNWPACRKQEEGIPMVKGSVKVSAGSLPQGSKQLQVVLYMEGHPSYYEKTGTMVDCPLTDYQKTLRIEKDLGSITLNSNSTVTVPFTISTKELGTRFAQDTQWNPASAGLLFRFSYLTLV